MGKKYRELKENLRKIPQRCLVVIDDLAIRKKEARKTLEYFVKIEKLAQSKIRFEQEDVRLFESWYDLTFRKEKQQIQDLADETRKLRDRHNHIMAISEMKKVSFWLAHQELSIEETWARSGSPQQKEEAERRRQERIKFIRSQIEAEHRRYEEERRKEFEAQDPGLHENDQKVYDIIRSSTPEQIHFLIQASGQHSLEMLMDGLFLCLRAGDFESLEKLWKAAPGPLKPKARKLFAEDGLDIEKVIQEKKFSDFGPSAEEEDPFEAEDGFFDFNEASEESAIKPISPSDEAKVKILFRILARDLHPDVLQKSLSEKEKPWFQNSWFTLQKAYQAKNLKKLEELMVLTRVKLGRLQELTLSEISSSVSYLEFDFLRLNQEVSELKNHRAWNFSKLKDYTKVEIKIKKDFQKEIEPLEEELGRLKMYPFIYKLESEEGPKKQRRRRARKRR